MSILNNSLLLGADAGGAGGYQVERSLRFNAPDSSFLSRTPASTGDRRKWTFSCWLKRSKLSSAQNIFVGADNPTKNNTTHSAFYFHPNDKLYFGGWNSVYITTDAVYRDPSAWYHIVLAVDTAQATATDRIKLYVNNSLQTYSQGGGFPAQNTDLGINQTYAHYIGGNDPQSGYADHMYADIHFIDGQALTPSSFTEVSATTGQLIPKAYTGSFGTNGFWLKFSDNSAATATTLGKDYSGNSNNWSPTNLSVTAGAGNDSLTDTPTSYGTDTGAGGEVRGNYATLNPLDAETPSSLRNGNLDQSGGNNVRATIGGIGSGKWLWEFTKTSNRDPGGSIIGSIGIFPNGTQISALNTFALLRDDGLLQENTGSVGNYATWDDGDVMTVTMNNDTSQYSIYKNGTLLFTRSYPSGITAANAFPAVRNNSGQSGATNFGQRPFAFPVSGFKALCTTNLPTPTIAQGSTVMDVALYSGNSGTQSISGYNLSPDFVWIKTRGPIANDHFLFDAVRGTTKSLTSNSTLSEQTVSNTLTSFDSGGFTTGSNNDTNASGRTFVAWMWDAGSSTVTNTQGSITSQVRANASAGFSIVTYTGTLSGNGNATVGHGLGVAPQLVITKARSATSRWAVQMPTALSANNYLELNTTAAQSSWGTQTRVNPTSTVFDTIYAGGVNESGVTYVAYCFAPVAGYNSISSYVGNGSSDGVFVYTGHRTRWLMIKRTDASDSWQIMDAARSDYNVADDQLYADLSNAEASTSTRAIDFLSNGFKVRGDNSGINANGGTYVYVSFAESPFQYARAR